jgi:talin
MAPIVLKIVIVKAGITRAVQCDPLMTVYDTCQHIRQKIPQASTDKPHTYGLFCTTEDPTQGYWLESVRTLKSYGLRSGSVVQYGSKYRVVRVLTLDHTLRSLLVDESLPLSHITRNVCAKIGLSNPQEFSFTVDDDTNQFTLRKREHSKHDHALATMKKQLHTDDTLMWVSPTQTLRQQALLDSSVVLTLRKKLFFTDENVNSNDPVQLHLLFVQCREAIVEGAHPVTKQEAIQLAALQLQVEFGNQKEGHVDKNFVKSMLKQVLPQEYFKEKAIDTLISTEHRKLYELSVLNAKFRYIQLCRSLRTYGVSFFAVKEKTPGRNKLRPVLLGVSRDGVHRLDKTSKTLLQRWPLSTVKSYASTPSSFCLNFGGYESAHSGGVYVVKTSEGEAIGQLLEGYILLIMEAVSTAHLHVVSGPLTIICIQVLQVSIVICVIGIILC